MTERCDMAASATRMHAKRETPRVDELAHFGAWGSGIDLNSAYVQLVDLARELERENARLQAELAAEREERRQAIDTFAAERDAHTEIAFEASERAERAEAALRTEKT